MDNVTQNQKTRILTAIHTVGIVFWIFLIISMKLYSNNPVGIIILLIPFLTSVQAIYNADRLTAKGEETIVKTNYLSLGIVIVIPLLHWVSNDTGVDSRRFGTIGILAIMLSLLSYIDFWVPEGYIFTLFHIQTLLRTYSIVLVVYALFSYYEIQPHGVFVTPKNKNSKIK